MTDWFAGHALDRVELQRRDPRWVADLWSDPSAVLLGVGPGRVATVDDRLALAPCDGDYDPEQHLLLGLIDSTPWFAGASAEAASSLREVMDTLATTELQAAFTAVGLADWHARSGFCPRCGSATSIAAAGMVRHCSGCDEEHYPRTDPAVIVAILDDDRLLLGRQPSWVPGRHSVFAGFVEVGESLEQAVHREMAEEVGLELSEVRYLGSQPWPFPRSLMVAFSARARTGELVVAEHEIERARWFTRDELRAALRDEVSLPYQTSIARRMIEAWLAGALS